MIQSLLRKKAPELWPAEVNEAEFYSCLLKFVAEPAGRNVFNEIARKAEKKNRPIRFHIALTKQLREKYGMSEEFNELYEDLPNGKDELIKLLLWITENGSIDEAVHLVWAVVPQDAKEIEDICDRVDVLSDQLRPYAAHLRQLASKETKKAKLEKRTTSDNRSSKPASRPVATSIGENLRSLQLLVADLSEESISAQEIASLSELVSHLKVAQESRDQDKFDEHERKAVLESVMAALKKSGINVEDEFSLSGMKETALIENVGAVKAMVQLLVEKNDAVNCLTKAMNTGVSAQQVAKAADAITIRDATRQELLELVVTKSSEAQRREQVVKKRRASKTSDRAARITKEPKEDIRKNVGEDKSVLHDNTTAQPDESDDTSDQLKPVRDVSESRKPRSIDVRGEELPADAGNDDKLEEVRTDLLDRLDSLSSSGQVSRCYWLLWANEQLEGSKEILPIAVRSIASAGALIPGEPPGAILRRSLSELATEDLSQFENSLLAVGAMIPTALFSQQKPTSLYALASQIRSGTGVPGIENLFEEVLSNCIDQNLWISQRAISSVATKGDRSSRIRELEEKALTFKKQLPHFSFTYRPAAEAFREAFSERADLGRLLSIIVGHKLRERDWLQEFLKNLIADDVLDSLISHKRHRGKAVATVQGAARTKMLHHIEQARDMAEEWLYYTSERIAEPNLQSQRRLVNLIQKLVPAAIESLRGQKSGNRWRNIALEITAQSLHRVETVLTGNSEGLDIGLKTTLAQQVDAVISSDLAPPETNNVEQLKALHDQLLRGDEYSALDATRKCLGRHEFNRALHLAEMEGVPEDVRDQVRESVEHGKDEVLRCLDEAESAVEDAYLLGLLESQRALGVLESEGNAETEDEISSELSRPALNAKLVDARKLASDAEDDEVMDLARSFEIVREVDDKIGYVRKNFRDGLLLELEDVLKKLQEGTADQRDDGQYLREISSRFQKAGDDIALSELVAQAKEASVKQERVTRDSAERNVQLQRFLSLEEDVAKKWSGPEKIAEKIKNKQNIAGICLDDKDTQYCEKAAAAVRSWASLRSWQLGRHGEKTIVDSVLIILRLFNVPLSSSVAADVKINIVNEFARLEIPVLGKCFESPLPDFGSALSQTLNVLVVRSKATARELAKYIESEKLSAQSVLVFYIPPIRSTDRMAFRTISVDKHFSALLVDFSMFLFSIGTRDPILTMFEIGLPYVWSQPYIKKGEKVAPEMFVGRDMEVEQVKDADGTSIIFGGRQLGKSALLRHVQSEHHDPENGMSIVYLDIDDLGNAPQDHKEMVKRLWSLICRELDHIGFILADELPRPQRKEYVDEVQKAIRDRLAESQNEHLIVLLDESDDLLDLDSEHDFQLIKQIRQLMVSTDRRFKVVFAGLQSVQRFTNYSNHPFAQLGEGVAIEPLHPRAAEGLVVKPMRALGFEFEDRGLVLRILSQTNYHPGLVQIFCNRLLDRVYNKNFSGPDLPRIIERHDVAAIERQQEFMDDIRNRFDWTLDLDDRYKVLIYALILSGDSAEPREDLEFLRLGAEWWPPVFDGMNRQTIRGLLDELVGMGVLFRDFENRVRVYRLRSPNLLRLLGSRSEIEAELDRLISRDQPRKPNPGSYRLLLSKRPPEFGPLTMEQSSKLLESKIKNPHPFQIRVVLGSEALGMSRVPAQVRSEIERLKEFGEEWHDIRISVETLGMDRVVSILKEKFKPTNRKNLFSVLDYTCIQDVPSPVHATELLKEELQQTCRKESRGLVILLLNEKATWQWICDEKVRDLTEDGRVQAVNLQRWSDGALAKGLEDVGRRSKARDNGEYIFNATNGLFYLGEMMIRRIQEDTKREWSQSQIEKAVTEIASQCSLFEGIQDQTLVNAVSNLADIAEGDEFEWMPAIDLLSEYGDPPKEVIEARGEKFREWLIAIGVLSPIRDNCVRLTPHLRIE